MREKIIHSDLERVRSLSDADAMRNAQDDPDSLPITKEFWRAAKKVNWKDRSVLLHAKKDIHIKIDEDVYCFFKAQTGGARGYQTLINSVLRQYMEHHLPNGG